MTPGRAEPAADRDQRTLRRAFGEFATGVTVMTVGDPHPHGMTANSFTSVSMDPPLALVCVGHEAVMYRRLAAGCFGVSVLAAAQEPVARHFADLSRPLGLAQFEHIDCEPGPTTGVPLIRGALARFELRVCGVHDGGDHAIFVGRVLWSERSAPCPDGALVFHRGSFHRLGARHSEVTA
ncbi:flavin reductase family protein [Actinomadura nitritigenes]|uniref:flavin reductase family protein n=1 Tax=Actinomadura nitritigenes TaxID=134602 RepID=UPI003D89C2D8